MLANDHQKMCKYRRNRTGSYEIITPGVAVLSLDINTKNLAPQNLRGNAICLLVENLDKYIKV